MDAEEGGAEGTDVVLFEEDLGGYHSWTCCGDLDAHSGSIIGMMSILIGGDKVERRRKGRWFVHWNTNFLSSCNVFPCMLNSF